MSFDKTKAFNDLYGIPNSQAPTWLGAKRLKAFHSLLQEELHEVGPLLMQGEEGSLEGLVALADWMADLVLYVESEAHRWGIPLPLILEVVRESNLTKLGRDGAPIRDSVTGKVMKGPNWKPPEPSIKQVLKRYGA